MDPAVLAKKRADIAASFQKTAVDHLVQRVGRPLPLPPLKSSTRIIWHEDCLCHGSQVLIHRLCHRAIDRAKELAPAVKSVLVAGGVAANKLVRRQLEATALEKGGRQRAFPIPPA